MGIPINKKQTAGIKKCAFFALLHLSICSFSIEGVLNTVDRNRVMLTDTVPASEVKGLNWNVIDRLVPVNGVLKAKQHNADSLIIRRKDYESYARENGLAVINDNLFTKVEIEPEYPGGPDAWVMFVKKQLRNPQENIKDTIKIIVQFIVEPDGTVHDVEAIAGSTIPGFREEATRLIKMSGYWNTAIQNFRIVKAYKKQAVTFTPQN